VALAPPSPALSSLSASALPIAPAARRSALVASTALAVGGVVAGAVRLLPWLLDPSVPWRVAMPFARGLLAVALEAALVVGWPVGWALASCRAVESGAARVFQALGESPTATVGRLVPSGAAFAALLGVAAAVSGTDAGAPGRVATELLVGARGACARVQTPATYLVPFTDMAWLCAPGREPRLAGALPGGLVGPNGRAAMTARAARIAGDFRAIELDDARLALPSETAMPASVAVHVGHLSVHGMAPWARASTLPAILRAVVLALSAWGAAAVAAHGVLAHALRRRAGAIVLGALGPVVALGLLRALERADARPSAFLVVPVAACGCTAIGAWLVPRLRERLGRSARAARWGLASAPPLP
jgi:hypothetical protein